MRELIAGVGVPAQGTAVALGTFDGVHMGHAAVLREAVRLGRERTALPCALLFRTHPHVTLRGSAPSMLITPDLRDRAMERLGIEALCPVAFDEVRGMDAEEFVGEVLVARFHARAVSCGYHFRFGRDRQGDPAALRRACDRYGLALSVADEVDYAGAPVSSTRIRAVVERGEMEQATAMLGRPFAYDFTVVGGDRRGRLLGFPTINQFFPDGFAVPRFGVYASQTFVAGKWHASVTNVGLRPTIGTQSLRSETCILGFSGDLYGQNVPVGLLRFLRPEVKFDSLEALTAEIAANSRAAEQIFKEIGEPDGNVSGDLF